jgi:hypothetical protein
VTGRHLATSSLLICQDMIVGGDGSAVASHTSWSECVRAPVLMVKKKGLYTLLPCFGCFFGRERDGRERGRGQKKRVEENPGRL